MIFPIQIGIVAGVYLGTRLWRRLRRRPNTDAATDTPLQQLADHSQQFRLSSVGVASSVVGATLYPPLGIANLVLISYTSVPIIDAAAHSLRHRREVRNDSYSALVSLLCLATGNLFAAAMHNAIFHLSCRAVASGKQQARQQLQEVFYQQPDNVWILREGVEIEIPLAEVQVGDALAVHTGELVPLDGVVTHGQALIDQQSLTGEAQPVERGVGDEVLATGLLVRGQLMIQVTQAGADSRAHRLNELLQQTGEFKTHLQLRGEQWSDQVALPVIATSALAWPLLGSSAALGLLFSAPTNTVRSLLSLQTSSHMQWATERGILIRDGRALEELLRVDTVLLDKTGTLTESQPQVGDIITCAELAADPLLAYAAAAEQHLQHPIASALLQAAEERGLLLPATRDNRYDLGLGVSVTIGSRRVHVGSPRFVQDITAVETLPREIQRAMRQGGEHSFILVALDGQIQGAIQLNPRLRDDALALVRGLRLRGRQRLAVVSGDQQRPTEQLAQQLGINECHASMLPRDKAALIRRLQAQGRRVCFIGDGLNDAIAMKQANVSICPGSSADLTRQHAQIVLLNDRLLGVLDSLDMAAHLHLRLVGSLGFWVSFGLFNALCVPLLHFGPVQSSVLYGTAFGLGFQRAKQPRLPAAPHPTPSDSHEAAHRTIIPGTILPMAGPDAVG